MVKKFLIGTQKVIVLISFYLLFLNSEFFSRVFQLATNDKSYLVIATVPIVLFLILIFVLNVLTLFLSGKYFKIVLSALIITASVSAYFMNTFGTVIDKDMLMNVVQTDVHEAFDLITFKLLFYVFVFGIAPTLVLFKIKLVYSSYAKEIINKLVFVSISFALIAVTYVLLSKFYSPFFRNHNELRFYTNPTYPMYSFGKFVSSKFKSSEQLVKIAEDAKKIAGHEKKLVVLVVGETARAANFQLNGYEKQTNPLLSQTNNITNLTDFYSCGTATAVSVPCMFSKFGRDDYSDDKQNYENLVDVLNKVDINVFWLDNNSGGSKGVANRMKNTKYYGGNIFDSVMFDDLKKSIDESTKDTFIVLHQQGSHGPTYYKRYPDNFKKFTPTCDKPEIDTCTKEEIVNTYNNTILYTDFFISEVIKILKNNENKFKASLVYVSDHGESLGENGIYLHGLPYVVAPDFQKHVPAIVWFGKGFEKEEKLLNERKNKHYSHDNLFHTILGVFNISTKEYDPKLDIFK